MTELQIDTGLKTFRVNGGAKLCFNPSDPNLYHRFLQAGQGIDEIQKSLAGQAQQAETPAQALALMARADEKIKALLNETFGPPNDFNAALQGVNLLAVCANGQHAVTNLLAALAPILEQGAQSFYRAAAAPALEKAAAARAARGDT